MQIPEEIIKTKRMQVGKKSAAAGTEGRVAGKKKQNKENRGRTGKYHTQKETNKE